MAKLVLSFQDMNLDEFPLDKDRTTIGRAADNDICIDNLAVSSHHAVLRNIAGGFILEDLKSSHGTTVNGHSIKEHKLRNGDFIIIGKHRLTYFGMAPSMANTSAGPNASAPRAVQAENQLAKLQVLSGSNAGHEMQLTKSLTKLGKPGLQVAAISRRQQGYYLIHVAAQDGHTPVINGEAIGSQARKLNDGDTLEIANTKIGFFLV